MRRSLAAAIAVFLLTAGCATKRPPQAALDPDLALGTFDRAWTIIRETHFDPELNGVDWLALRDELRPKAAAAQSVEDLRETIRDMLSRLGQSHFALIPFDTVDPDLESKKGGGGQGQVGLELRAIGGEFVVTTIDPLSAAAASAIRPGFILRAVDDRAVDEWRQRYAQVDDGHDGRVVALGVLLAELAGPPGSTARLELLDASDRPVRVDLERTPPPGESVQLGNLPPFFARLSHSEVALDERGGKVGLVRFNVWMTTLAGPIAEAVDRYRGHDGIVVDLRGNPGGVSGMVMGTAGHFLDEVVSLGTMRLRSQQFELTANPRRVSPAGQRVQPYAGPLAILIDELSASTSEIFAGGMQAIGRARIFGGRSAGMALPALMERLPNQDVLYHAIADFTTPAGLPLERMGVVPDVEVEPTREGLLASRDETLEAALRWIAEERESRHDDGSPSVP